MWLHDWYEWIRWDETASNLVITLIKIKKNAKNIYGRSRRTGTVVTKVILMECKILFSPLARVMQIMLRSCHLNETRLNQKFLC